MRIGIVGHGVVGSAMVRFIERSPETSHCVIYDKFQEKHNSSADKRKINSCNLVFLCVPTPVGENGECDTSIVEECAAWITVPLCIRSTIPPGTTDRLSYHLHSEIAFSPEYLGESPTHPWHDEGACGFLIIGGSRVVCELTNELYRSIVGGIRYYFTTASTAELVKYMANSYLSTKVAFVNQFCDLAAGFGVDFEELRGLWLVDPRVGTSHTIVTKERGFSGRCFPKDLAAIVAAAQGVGGAPLLKAVLDYNESLRGVLR